MMMGGAARVDLLGARVAPFLARWLHQTIHGKLLKLPNSVRVYPTHAGGSFCSAAAPPTDLDYTTIGEEREHNPFAAETEESSFVKFALTGMGSYPSYFKFMADINRRGPDVLGGVPQPASLTPLSVRNQMNENASLVDARQPALLQRRARSGVFRRSLRRHVFQLVGLAVALGSAVDTAAAGSLQSRRHRSPANTHRF